jgi:hypothetical protein
VKQVERAELLDLGAYEQVRPHFRQRVMALKKRRRIDVGAHMSMVFENHDTVLLQVQEMLRTERISDERAIAHELSTYNELIPPPGGLCATLFIEYEDSQERARMLQRLSTLREHMHLVIGNRRITAKFTVQYGEEMERLPAVNYLSFDAGADAAAALRDEATEAALVVDHPDYTVKAKLPPELRDELASDLAS